MYTYTRKEEFEPGKRKHLIRVSANIHDHPPCSGGVNWSEGIGVIDNSKKYFSLQISSQ